MLPIIINSAKTCATSQIFCGSGESEMVADQKHSSSVTIYVDLPLDILFLIVLNV